MLWFLYFNLYHFLGKRSAIRKNFKLLKDCVETVDYSDVLDTLSEQNIRDLFDSIKSQFGARVFGKGYLYRIISSKEVYDVSKLSDDEKKNGIKTKVEAYVPYDKGDKDGNRWYLETPFRINWSRDSFKKMKDLPGNRWDGSNFFFREGFCVNNVLNPNSTYFKTRLKDATVNDVASMSLFDESNIGDKYFVITLNQ